MTPPSMNEERFTTATHLLLRPEPSAPRGKTAGAVGPRRAPDFPGVRKESEIDAYDVTRRLRTIRDESQVLHPESSGFVVGSPLEFPS
jgi:hypothetical protein